jgi:hypothetical protein
MEGGEKLEKKAGLSRFIAVLAICCLLSFSLGYHMQIENQKHGMTVAKANVYFTVESANGVSDWFTGNVITDIGENATLYGVSGVAFDVKYISIGNATASQTLTQLTQEYARSVADSVTYWVYSGDYAKNVTKKFTFSETVTLNAAGLHWASSGNGNMYAVANFPSQQTFQANWNLTITWMLVFNAN